MSQTEVINIDYSGSRSEDIVHAKIINRLDEAIDQMKKNEVKLKIGDRRFHLNKGLERNIVPTIKLRRLEPESYRLGAKSQSKIVTQELDLHEVKKVIFLSNNAI